MDKIWQSEVDASQDAPRSQDVSRHPLEKELYNAAHEAKRKHALFALLSQIKQQERKDAEILTEAMHIMESRMSTKASEEVELAVSIRISEPVEMVPAAMEYVSPSSNNRPTPLTIAPATTTIDTASTPSSLHILRVYLRTHVSSSAGLRTIKRVNQTSQDLGVNVKPKVPTKAVCAEHLELRQEILTLLNLKEQLQNREAEASSNRDGSYTETQGSHKRSYRGDPDRPFIPDSVGFGGERIGKQGPKRKAPVRFVNTTPPSPSQSKRPPSWMMAMATMAGAPPGALRKPGESVREASATSGTKSMSISPNATTRGAEPVHLSSSVRRKVQSPVHPFTSREKTKQTGHVASCC